MKTLLAAAALSAAVAVPASASVTFDFSGSSSAPSATKSFSESGLTVIARPYNFNDINNTVAGPDGNVTQNTNGLGVARRDGENPEINGPEFIGNGDLLVLDFGTTSVDLLSVTFSEWDDDDNFDFALDALGSVSFPIEDQSVAGSGSVRTFTFAAPQSGTSFGFGSDTVFSIFGGGNDYRVASITVAAIPLPAAGLVLLTALGGASAAYRRGQKKKAA